MRYVYIDVLFLINLVLDYLILLLTARISGVYAKRTRILAAAVLGAVYAVLVFFEAPRVFYGIFAKLAVSAIMILMTFGFCPGAVFFKLTLLFYVLSFTLGGIVLVSGLIRGGNYSDMINGAVYINIPFKTLVFMAGICYAAVSLVFRAQGKNLKEKRKVVQVKAAFTDKKTVFSALVDTGNELVDPVTGKKVAVADLSVALRILPEGPCRVLRMLKTAEPFEVLEALSAYGEAARFRLIPFRTVDNKGGMMLAFKTDYIEIEGRLQKDALLGIVPSLKSCDGHEALVGA